VHPETPNPFREATYGELSQALNDACRTLEARTFGTRAEKEAFAERLRHLLLACGMRFMDANAEIPGNPEVRLHVPGASVADCFIHWYRLQVQRDISAVRSYTLWRAADYVLGKKAYHWLDTPGLLWSKRRSYIGTLDDDNLLIVLQQLDDAR
jgi:hypothetical protein